MTMVLCLILVLLSVGLGIFIYTDPGYALFSYGNLSVEMPLWVSALLSLAVFILLYFVGYIFQSLLGSLNWLQRFRRQLKKRYARSHSTKGLLAFSEGHFALAEKYMKKAAKFSETPFIYYLMAARSAQEQKAHARRDEYLKLAHDCEKENDLAVQLTQAELQYKQGQYEQSLATLKALSQKYQKHSEVLKWKHLVYLALNDFQSLSNLLPILKKNKILPKKSIESLEAQSFEILLQKSCYNKNLDQILTLWQKAPIRFKSSSYFVGLYAQALMGLSQKQEAEKILYEFLKKQWDENLMSLYGQIKSKDLKKQLAFSEGFLKTHQNNPTLLLALGRLSILNQLWGKAKDYLEASLHIQPRPETYAILAKLLEELGEQKASQAYYQKGLVLAVDSS